MVGMHSKHKDAVLASMDLTDKVIVDLDEDSIICNQDVTISILINILLFAP